jgi:hypothetical protein
MIFRQWNCGFAKRFKRSFAIKPRRSHEAVNPAPDHILQKCSPLLDPMGSFVAA